MPKVGKRSFDYTPKGLKEAKEWSSITGQPIRMKYKGGGKIATSKTKAVKHKNRTTLLNTISKKK